MVLVNDGPNLIAQCDGESPCKRCKDDGLVCTAGSRKKTEYKQLPRGLVVLFCFLIFFQFFLFFYFIYAAIFGRFDS